MHARAHTHRTTHYYRHRHHTLRKWKANRLLMNQSSWLSIYPSCCLHHSKGRFSMFWSVFSLSLSSSRFAVSVFVAVLSLSLPPPPTPPVRLSLHVCLPVGRSTRLHVCLPDCLSTRLSLSFSLYHTRWLWYAASGRYTCPFPFVRWPCADPAPPCRLNSRWPLHFYVFALTICWPAPCFVIWSGLKSPSEAAWRRTSQRTPTAHSVIARSLSGVYPDCTRLDA